MLVKVFIGLVAFAAVLVLMLGGHPRKTPVVEASLPPRDPAAKETRANEVKDWARDLIEQRRRRLEG
jgi:hypothetical protein